MKPYLVNTPRLVQWLFPGRVWAFSRKEPGVYLTFDDGPIPEVTPWVLDELKKHNVKATFFCIGDNVRKHPEIFERIVAEGHIIGNHTFHHLNGWKTKTEEYLQDVEAAEVEFNKTIFNRKRTPKLFRPPYGKMTSAQAKEIQQKGYKIIMWDVLSADFDAKISAEKCLQNVLNNIKPGSIVAFHDSLKAEKNLRFVLPKVLEFCFEKKYTFSRI